MCNCIAGIEDKIKSERGTNLVFMMRPGRSEIGITPITRVGEYAKHRRYTSVNWKYCPFCGELKGILTIVK